MHPQYHLHIRKRVHQKLEQYPHPKKWKRLLDRAVLAMSVIAPMMTFVQAWEIWISKSADNLSFITWTTYLVSSVIWLGYGIAHRERPIIIANILYTISTLIIFIEMFVF